MNAPEMNASWLTEQGRVRAIDGDSVLVEVGVKSACGHCEHGAGCGVSKLGRLVRVRPLLWRLPNTLGAREGDQVTLALPPGDLTGAVARAYGLPLAGFVGAAVLAALGGAGEGATVGSAFTGLALGLWAARRSSQAHPVAPVLIARKPPDAVCVPLHILQTTENSR
ncbi:MAG: SoxR reducing system RseC family protein [Halothiobacillaceae bacterium]|jgi:sigma-E factor negative regulatory protein RseC|nr:SoxR reducing system RseC family protein [Halothiobacillaceae bacterium]